MSVITDILNTLGYPYAEDTFAPKRPPQTGACIVYHDDCDTAGSDSETDWVSHVYDIDVYDDGDRTARTALETALNGAGLKYHRNAPVYIYSEKRFETVYELEEIIEKL